MNIKKKKLVIFGQGRSGTTLLKHLLNSHPLIQCDGELLNADEKYYTSRIARKVVYEFPITIFNRRAKRSDKPAYGFTLLFYQYKPQDKILKKLSEANWHLIHLQRNNAFDQTVSHFVALQTRLWHRTSENTETEDDISKKLVIDPDIFQLRYKWIKLNKQVENAIFNTLPHIKLVYEDHLLNEECWQEALDGVFSFLDLPGHPVHAPLKKTYSVPYSEIVSNYQELKQLVNA